MNYIGYGDDVILIARNIHDLLTILNAINTGVREGGLQINVGKTTLLIVGGKESRARNNTN